MQETVLINNLQNGDEQAYRQFVDAYEVQVFNTVLSLVQKREEAEDLAQEVFMEVFRSIGKFKGDSSLQTWVYRIATNKSLESIRKKKTAKRFAFLSSLFGAEQELLHHPVEFDHPGVQVEKKEMAKILFQAISKLPENQRAAYTLAQVEGLSYEEVAAVLETTKSSVESLLFRAKGNLKKVLRNYYESVKNEF